MISLIFIILWMKHGVGKGILLISIIFVHLIICIFFCSVCHFNKTNFGNLKKTCNFRRKICLSSSVGLILKSLAKRNDWLENLATFQTNPI